MKKFTTLILLLAAMLPAMAQVQYGTEQYAVRAYAGYAHNTTYGSYGVFDFGGFMPINQHFEMQADLRLSTAGNHAFGVQLRPKFTVPVGEMFIEARLLSNLYKRDGYNDFTQLIGVGYRMDYVSVTIGMFGRVIDDWQRSWYSTESFVAEPFNLLYRLEVYCRPQANPWNLWFSFSNIDDHQMERMWQPLFGIGAWYNVTEHWRVLLDAQCKPTGMFHLDATFYGATVRAGFSYRF